MRKAAIILNVLLLIGVGLIVAEDGIPSSSDDFFLVFLLLVVTPPFTILSLFMSKSESWLTLYFRRKAAEEKRRIAEIENDPNDK